MAAYLQERFVVAHDIHEQAVQGGPARSTPATQDRAIRKYEAAQKRKIVVARVVANVHWAATHLRKRKVQAQVYD